MSKHLLTNNECENNPVNPDAVSGNIFSANEMELGFVKNEPLNPVANLSITAVKLSETVESTSYRKVGYGIY
jgi:hypothetical protein